MAKLGEHLSTETRAKMSAATKGRKLSSEWKKKISEAHRGKKLSREHIEKLKLSSKGKNFGDKHGMWRGDKVGYSGLHTWVRTRLGTPSECENCGMTDTGRRYEWANISGLYMRDLGDWARLCKPCHALIDGNTQYNHLKKKHEQLTAVYVFKERAKL